MKKEIKDSIDGLSGLLPEFAGQADNVEKIALALASAVRNGKKILLCGNGGSAAESQHMAAELVGRFQKERKAFPAVSLTTDTSVITSLANDYSFDNIFSRQVEAIGVKGDVLVVFSTSGNSGNAVKAAETAKKKGLLTVGVLGAGGRLAARCDLSLKVNDPVTARVQEIHLLFVHIVCGLLEKELG